MAENNFQTVYEMFGKDKTPDTLTKTKKDFSLSEVSLPKASEGKKRKGTSFYLKKETIDKLRSLAEEQGYPNISKFLEELVDQL